MGEADNHWSIVDELNRKAVEAIERINDRLASNEITQTEAGAAFEMVYWMIAGISGDTELEKALGAMATQLNKGTRFQLFASNDERTFVVRGNGDRYGVGYVETLKYTQVDSGETKTGFAYICDKLENLGYEKIL